MRACTAKRELMFKRTLQCADKRSDAEARRPHDVSRSMKIRFFTFPLREEHRRSSVPRCNRVVSLKAPARIGRRVPLMVAMSVSFRRRCSLRYGMVPAFIAFSSARLKAWRAYRRTRYMESWRVIGEQLYRVPAATATGYLKNANGPLLSLTAAQAHEVGMEPYRICLGYRLWPAERRDRRAVHRGDPTKYCAVAHTGTISQSATHALAVSTSNATVIDRSPTA